MAVCSICNKGKMAGRHVRHVHSGLWERKAPAKPRVFLPNIQKKKLQVTKLIGKKHETTIAQIKLCTKCLKRITNYPGWKGYRLTRNTPQTSTK